MTELPDPLPLGTDDDDAEGGASRRHALWAMVVLGCLALIVGCLMVLVGGGGGGQHRAVNIMPPVQTPSNTTHHSVGAEKTSRSPHSKASDGVGSSGSALPRSPAGAVRHGDPCPGASNCTVAGDGGALAAVNAFRTSHGLSPVSGGVSPNAQTCAQNKGSGPTCVPHYAWTSLPAQNGAKAVAKIAAFGSDWLLDRSTTTMSVGWAYVGGQYECVLLKAP